MVLPNRNALFSLLFTQASETGIDTAACAIHPFSSSSNSLAGIASTSTCKKAQLFHFAGWSRLLIAKSCIQSLRTVSRKIRVCRPFLFFYLPAAQHMIPASVVKNYASRLQLSALQESPEERVSAWSRVAWRITDLPLSSAVRSFPN